MKVSLVLATYGRTSDISRLFASLADQTSSEFEVIVVDQNSDDRLQPLIEMGRLKGLDIRHERLGRPSLSGARNRGIALARYGIIAFPDDDCWYDNQVIEEVCRAFASVAGLDGVVANWVEQVSGREIAPYFIDYQAWRRFRGGNASSISLFVSRDCIRGNNGFDERFGVGCWYGAAEEIDFILRALGGGAKMAYCPVAKVHHRFDAKPTGNLLASCYNARNRARGTGALYAKHRLPLHVVLRGLLAPLLAPIVGFKGLAEVVRGAFVTLGRLEGLVRWSCLEK